MRQLTSLDAQFLNVESARIFGHVAFLGIYDPSTAPGGKLGAAEVQRLLEERLHLLPPLRWRLVEVPLGHRPAVLGRRPGLRPRLPRPRVGDPAAGRRPPARRDRLTPVRPPARPRPAAVGVLRHPRAARGPRGAADARSTTRSWTGSPATRSWPRCSTPSPTGRVIDPAPRGNGPGGADPARPRDVPARPARHSRASRCGRCARCPTTVAGFTDLPGANALPGVPTLSHVYSRVRRTFGSDESTGVLEVTKARAPMTPFNGPVSAHRRFAFGSLSLDAVRQVRREFGTTVNDVVVTLCAGRGARLADRARRAAGGPARGADPDVRAQARRARRVGQPDLDDDRPDPDQRAGPGRRGCGARTSCCAAPRSATARCPPRC